MKDDINDIRAYYEEAAEDELNRLNRHQLERDISWQYLDKYLPPRGAILDIRAGAGIYTIELARRGYTVTAVDISEKLIALITKRASEGGLDDKVKFLVADARELGDIGHGEFDVVLLMGPLYHLVYEEDRKTALREAFNRLKPGGTIFSSFISRYGIWGDILKSIPETIERQLEVDSVLELGRDPEGIHTHGFRGYFTTVPEIAPLHEEIGFETLVMAAAEPCISADDESYNKLTGTMRQSWLDFLLRMSTENSIIAASRHLLYIGRKPKN